MLFFFCKHSLQVKKFFVLILGLTFIHSAAFSQESRWRDMMLEAKANDAVERQAKLEEEYGSLSLTESLNLNEELIENLLKAYIEFQKYASNVKEEAERKALAERRHLQKKIDIPTLIIEANNGNTKAMYRLGLAYYSGFVTDNFDEVKKYAFQLFKESADNGYAPAQNFTAQMYERNEVLGENENLSKAEEYYIKAANNGYAASEYNLEKVRAKLNLENSIELAKSDDPEALFLLGLAARHNLIDQSSSSLFQKSAELGYPYAAYELGRYGMKLTKKKEKQLALAITGFEKFAQEGSVEAMLKLADCYRTLGPYSNLGDPENEEKAKLWYQSAADSGSAEALYQLYEYYRRDYPDQGYSILKQASDKGHTLAQMSFFTWHRAKDKLQEYEGRYIQEKAITDINKLKFDFSQRYHKAKVTIVYAWAGWCPPCLGMIADLIELGNRYSPDQLEIIYWSLDKKDLKMMFHFAEMLDGRGEFLCNYLPESMERTSYPEFDSRWEPGIPATFFYKSDLSRDYLSGRFSQEQIANKIDQILREYE